RGCHQVGSTGPADVAAPARPLIRHAQRRTEPGAGLAFERKAALLVKFPRRRARGHHHCKAMPPRLVDRGGDKRCANMPPPEVWLYKQPVELGMAMLDQHRGEARQPAI